MPQQSTVFNGQLQFACNFCTALIIRRGNVLGLFIDLALVLEGQLVFRKTLKRSFSCQ